MRRKLHGYVLQFTSADHHGRNIHVYQYGREIGVYDAISGPIRGLDSAMNVQLRGALDQFIHELNERGFFIR